MPEPGQLAAQHRHALHSTLTTDRWEPQVSGGPVHLGVRDGQLDVEARPTGSDRWVYPTATLKPGERAPSHAQGLAFSWTRLAGSGECRVILEEANGSSYVISLPPPPQAGVQTNWVAWFDDAVPGTGWSKPDPNHRLDAAEIRRVKLGCNTRDDRVQFRIGEPQWILGDESD
jgi:hypothetical protein